MGVYLYIDLRKYIFPQQSTLRRWCTQIMISHPHGNNKIPKNQPWRWPGARYMKLSSIRKYIVGAMVEKTIPKNAHISGLRAFPKVRIWHNAS